ncbi:MAG: molybdenum cofactor guanylyltransferase [Acidimicrobiia bacterium]|nr:molybdenum cofactor guanylyltransferase [Acidimicrobiia bacterium]
MRAAIVLAGGAARRLGGVDKALVEIGGTTMLDRVLAAAAPNVDELVVVGPQRATNLPRVRFTLEDRPGGGPVPAVAAGLGVVREAYLVVVLAVDLPLLETEHIATLVVGLANTGADAVAAADHRGQPNPLLAAYRGDHLRAAASRLGADTPAAGLLPAATGVVDLGEAGALNVNQPEELERARRRLRLGP